MNDGERASRCDSVERKVTAAFGLRVTHLKELHQAVITMRALLMTIQSSQAPTVRTLPMHCCPAAYHPIRSM
jgi:hypothetical protein